jgi:hypothetical protein
LTAEPITYLSQLSAEFINKANNNEASANAVYIYMAGMPAQQKTEVLPENLDHTVTATVRGSIPVRK